MSAVTVVDAAAGVGRGCNCHSRRPRFLNFKGAGFKAQSYEFAVQGFRFEVRGLGFRV